ncbi:hypothetical protein [Actinokineospora globicatena]|uniref:Uncharacterized protein n=1 Tax=Actinokineospora globicatena TaxID=103729 RepID=A0A9W6V9T5_9PSEU|nr:hypothetical protein [Actinokineospora globicatena]GLW95525.1 hypothetical protein Aglo03_63410 [Actinokineospora globicatena]
MAGAVLATACSAAPDPDPSALVAWADRFCAVVADTAVVLATPLPDIDLADPDAARAALAAYLAAVTDGLSRAVSGIDALAPSPMTGGDRAAHVAADTYRGLRAPLDEARTVLDDNATAHVLAEVAGEVAPEVAALDLADPLAGTAGSDFTRWAERAPQCDRVPALRG